MNIAKGKKDMSGSNLVKRIRQGDEQAFEELFCEYYYDLYSFAYQFTSCEERAKDLVQDVFIKVWKRREKWKINRSVKAYLFKAIRNSAINHINKRGRRSEVREIFSREEFQNIKDSVGFGHEEDDLIDQIWNAVEAMPKRRRRVFILYHRNGLSYDEISDVLDISRKTVENHMGLALKDIRAQIG